MVRILAAIIRLVEELDREHLQRISRLTIRRRGKVVTMALYSRNKVIVERWGADLRKEVLERLLDIEISIS
jgi:hypothetical protein